MSDNELTAFVNLPTRYQRARRLKCHALNDGSDEEAPEEDHIFKKPRLTSQSTIDSLSSHELIFPEDSASQVLPTIDSSQSDTSLPSGSFPNPRIKPHNQWLWTQFSINVLPGKLWQPKRGKRQIEDREICCIHCPWKTTDSARATSTSNLRFHLIRHGLSEDSQHLQQELEIRPNRQSIATMFKKRTEANVIKTLEQNIVRWSVIDYMAFTAIESSAFRQIFENIPNITLPFSSRETLTRRIDTEFNLYRAQLIQDLAETCQTIALSLDIWTSENSKPILGVIGHWLTADFEYKEQVLEFAELHGAHSGENMAELLNIMLIELKIECKLLTITGDNATSNETLVSELFFHLAEKYPTAIQVNIESNVKSNI
jgi:hypothetical protein